MSMPTQSIHPINPLQSINPFQPSHSRPPHRPNNPANHPATCCPRTLVVKLTTLSALSVPRSGVRGTGTGTTGTVAPRGLRVGVGDDLRDSESACFEPKTRDAGMCVRALLFPCPESGGVFSRDASVGGVEGPRAARARKCVGSGAPERTHGRTV